MNYTKNQIEKILTWKNNVSNLKNINDDNWIVKNHVKIYKYIINTYYNTNTLKTHITCLCSIMKIHELTNHYKKKCNKYSSESTNLNNIVNENYKYQIIDPKRLNNYVTYSELVERREMLNDMFLNNDTLTNTQLYYLNMKHLILSVYTMQPPLRHEYKDLIILNMAYNTQSNYIVNDDNKFIIYINNDKVIRSHGNIKLHLCDELNKIILRSLKHFPRTFLFSNFKDYTQPIGKQGLENLIKSCFDDKKINVDIIRSAYITHFYNNKKMNIHEKEILAIHMRHSVTTAERVYRKIVLDD